MARVPGKPVSTSVARSVSNSIVPNYSVTSPLLPFLKGNGGKFTPLQSPFNILRRPSLDVVPRKRVEKYN